MNIWNRWKEVVKRDLLYIILIIILLSAFVYVSNRAADCEVYCRERMEEIGCIEVDLDKSYYDYSPIVEGGEINEKRN